MLRDYLSQFAIASKAQSERIYLDAFAGEGDGRDRLTGQEFHGSARIALDVGNGTGFTRFRYFELEPKAAELKAALQADYPDRDITVYAGDCNVTIPQALAELNELNWAPTFAFVDPDGMEVAWETLAALADHKRGYRAASSPKPEYKVEIWMLFPSAGIMRTLALDAETLPERDVARATRLFGTERWQSIYELRRSDQMSAKQSREEYVNLMRWRLEQDLGYRYTHPFELRNTAGAPLYHMILATDNDAGTRIMSAIYTNVAKTVPEMRQQARDRRQGQQAFTFDVDVAAEQPSYTYEPAMGAPRLSQNLSVPSLAVRSGRISMRPASGRPTPGPSQCRRGARQRRDGRDDRSRRMRSSAGEVAALVFPRRPRTWRPQLPAMQVRPGRRPSPVPG